MIYIQFSLLDKTFFNAKDKWEKEGKSPEEISSLTSKLLQDVSNSRPMNVFTKFPKWLRDFLASETGLGHLPKLSFDEDNDTFKGRLDKDMLETQDSISDIEKRYVKLIENVPEYQAFSETFQLRISATASDETSAMVDLENYMRGAGVELPKQPQKKSSSDRSPEEIEADVIEEDDAEDIA